MDIDLEPANAAANRLCKRDPQCIGQARMLALLYAPDGVTVEVAWRDGRFEVRAVGR